MSEKFRMKVFSVCLLLFLNYTHGLFQNLVDIHKDSSIWLMKGSSDFLHSFASSLHFPPEGRIRKAQGTPKAACSGGAGRPGWPWSPNNFQPYAFSFLASLFWFVKWGYHGEFLWNYNNLSKVPKSQKEFRFFSCYYADVHSLIKNNPLFSSFHQIFWASEGLYIIWLGDRLCLISV